MRNIIKKLGNPVLVLNMQLKWAYLKMCVTRVPSCFILFDSYTGDRW